MKVSLALCICLHGYAAIAFGEMGLGESIAADLKVASADTASLTPATIKVIEGVVKRYATQQAPASQACGGSKPAKVAAWRGGPGGAMEWPRKGVAWDAEYPKSIPEPKASPRRGKPLSGNPADVWKRKPGEVLQEWDWKTGKPKQSQPGNLKFCVTQISVRRCTSKAKKCVARGQFTCTSCQHGSALQIRYPHVNAGTCNAYSAKSKAAEGLGNTQILCSKYYGVGGKNTLPKRWEEPDADLMEPNMLCTKVASETHVVRIKGMNTRRSKSNPQREKKSAAFKYFNDFSRKNGNQFTGVVKATCNVWKQVVCEGPESADPVSTKSGVRTICQTKKEVKCVEVCQMKNWEWGKNSVGICSKEMCQDPEFGYLACLETATMA